GGARALVRDVGRLEPKPLGPQLHDQRPDPLRGLAVLVRAGRLEHRLGRTRGHPAGPVLPPSVGIAMEPLHLLERRLGGRPLRGAGAAEAVPRCPASLARTTLDDDVIAASRLPLQRYAGSLAAHR